MNPEDALQLLDAASRLAPLSYDDQVRRCTAVDVLKKAIEPAEEKVAEDWSPSPESVDASARPVARKGAKK